VAHPRRAVSVLLAVAAAATCSPTLAWAAATHSPWPAARDGTIRPDLLRGTARADYLRGHESPDRLFGRGGDDLLTGDTGSDRISGGAGDDTITGAAGGDRLNGDGGRDVIVGGFGGDRIKGGAGDDTLDGENDADIVVGGPGNDVLHGGSGPDLVDGGAGDDVVYGESGSNFLTGGRGDDVIFVEGNSGSRVDCGAGNDTLYVLQTGGLAEGFTAESRAATAGCERTYATDAATDPARGETYLAPDGGGEKSGTARDDLLLGGPGADTLHGGAGNDVLWGLREVLPVRPAPDVLDGGPGDDTIYGGPGPQRIDAGPGDDFINGGLGDGTIRAGSGNDTIRLRGSGTNTVSGEAGDDTIHVNGKAVGRVRCGAGRDTVYANRGDAVARDCERVIASAGSRPSRLRQASAPTYADLVRATPGLTHWWRMSPVAAPTVFAPFVALRDEVTGDVRPARGAAEPGVTDDGDAAWLAQDTVYGTENPLSPATGSTAELWVLSAPQFTGVQDVVFARGPASVALTATGAVQAVVQPSGGPGVSLRTPDGAVAPDGWHHVAFTRDGTTARLYLDGAEVASGPDGPGTGTQVNVGAYPTATLRGLDEVATYDRALTADTISAHARAGDDGQPPVTRADPPIPARVGGGFATRLSSGHAGARYSCALDGGAEFSCPENLTIGDLAAGAHTLRIRARDRFGRGEVAPVTHAFTFDPARPVTVAAAMVGVLGPVPLLVTMGSDDATATYECATASIYEYVGPQSLAWSACAPGFTVPSDRPLRVFVRAVSATGARDLAPVEIYLEPASRAARRPANPALGGARADLQAGASLGRIAGSFSCGLDARPLQPCSPESRLPILYAGPHVLQVRQQVPGMAAPVAMVPLRFTVGGAPDVRLTTVQFPPVVEAGPALARHVPRVRFTVGAASRVTFAFTRGRRRVAAFTATVADGPSAVRLPARVLRRLKLGRYDLRVTAAGAAGGQAQAGLRFAVIPRNR
jgi:hypothetical protein